MHGIGVFDIFPSRELVNEWMGLGGGMLISVGVDNVSDGLGVGGRIYLHDKPLMASWCLDTLLCAHRIRSNACGILQRWKMNIQVCAMDGWISSCM